MNRIELNLFSQTRVHSAQFFKKFESLISWDIRIELLQLQSDGLAHLGSLGPLGGFGPFCGFSGICCDGLDIVGKSGGETSLIAGFRP